MSKSAFGGPPVELFFVLSVTCVLENNFNAFCSVSEGHMQVAVHSFSEFSSV